MPRNRTAGKWIERAARLHAEARRLVQAARETMHEARNLRLGAQMMRRQFSDARKIRGG